MTVNIWNDPTLPIPKYLLIYGSLDARIRLALGRLYSGDRIYKYFLEHWFFYSFTG